MQVAGSKQADAPPSPSTSPVPEESDMFSHADTPTPMHTNEPELQAEPPAQPHRSAHLRKPSRIVHDIQSGEGIPAQHVPGLQIPGSSVEEAEEAGGVWTITDGSPALLEDFDGLEHVFTAETADTEALEPHLLTEAKQRPDWLLWEKAIQEELATLKAAGTWRLEEAPPNANIIGSKWVFKAKKDTAGNIAWYKARLVAQGFSQIDGVNYDDTYAPVTHLASSRAIIAMANCLHLELQQVDIKGAYLNGMLNEGEVLYMWHPPGYKSHDTGNCVLHLVKTLYGLKQSGCHWYQKLSAIFLSLGFQQCSVDQAVFHKSDKHKKDLTVIAVHVDDCTIAASSACLVEDFKAGLCRHIEVTDLGALHWMLGIK